MKWPMHHRRPLTDAPFDETLNVIGAYVLTIGLVLSAVSYGLDFRALAPSRTAAAPQQWMRFAYYVCAGVAVALSLAAAWSRDAPPSQAYAASAILNVVLLFAIASLVAVLAARKAS